MAAADALAPGAGIGKVQERLAAAGLELLGACERLSARPQLLREAALLQDFTPAEADALGAAMILVRAQAGQVLITEGEASDWMMLLLSGTVDVAKRRAGAEFGEQGNLDTARIAVLKAGAVIGEMSMLDGEPRYASCIALQQVEAAVLTRDAVARLISQNPAVGAKLLVKITQLLAQRLRNTSNQVVRLLHKNSGVVSAH